MRMRNRLAVVLIGLLSMGAVVAMVPSGGAAAGQPRIAQPAKSTTCSQAKKLANTSLRLVGKHLSSAEKASYATTLDKAVQQACAGTLTCGSMEDIIAELRSIRDDELPDSLESRMSELEDAFLQLFCSS